MVLVEECAPASGPSTDASSPQEPGDVDCESEPNQALSSESADVQALPAAEDSANSTAQVPLFACLAGLKSVRPSPELSRVLVANALCCSNTSCNLPAPVAPLMTVGRAGERGRGQHGGGAAAPEAT